MNLNYVKVGRAYQNSALDQSFPTFVVYLVRRVNLCKMF